jgi:hypothetical protein
MPVDLKDYPALYQESCKCADCSQKKHLQILKIRIGLLVGYATLGAVAWSIVTNLSFIPLIAITLALTMVLVFTAILETRKYNRLWFNSRTIAETVKKESWLYMMKAKPYHQDKPEDEVEQDFINALRVTAEADSSVIPEFSQYHEENTQLTNYMKETRKADLQTRVKTYKESRLQDQQRWYARKARLNLKQASHYTILVWFFQALTVIFALINVLLTNLPFNLIGIATTSAAAILLWANTKGYNELSQSYGYIAQNLSFYEDKTKYLTTENQLNEFVLEVERTMNHERAVWTIRRQPSLKLEK